MIPMPPTEEYFRLVKNKCASCEKEFENSITKYSQYGNYDSKCINIVNANLLKHPKDFKDMVKLFKPLKTKNVPE